MEHTLTYFIIYLIIGLVLWSIVMYLIFKRKAVEDDLKASQTLLQNVLDTIPDRVFWKDLNSIYFGCNKLFAEDAGLSSPEDIVGKDDYKLSWSKEAELYRGDDRSVMQTKTPKLFYEEPQTRPDGKKLWLETSKIPLIDKYGKVYGILGTYRDITDRKMAEEALINAKREAEDATEVKDKFVSLVAHDLKNPLSSLCCYIEMLGDDSLKNDVKESIIKEAKEDCAGMNSLINEVLSLSRIKAGRITPKFVFIDASTIVNDVISGFRNLSAQKGINIINEIPSNTRVYADFKLFHEVLANILSNAIKFTNKGGAVRLFLPEEDPSTIAVADTGIGMEEAKIKKLFKFEEKTSTIGTWGETGTGFGLPLSYEIMKAHGGSINVESGTGKGSVFYLALPLIKPKILSVDDEEIFRKSLIAVFDGMEMEFLEACSAESAFELLKESPVHLIISDLAMPGMGGLAFLELLKKDAGTADIPVIIATGDNDIEIRNQVFRMGASDFIVKPVLAEELIPRVRRYIA